MKGHASCVKAWVAVASMAFLSAGCFEARHDPTDGPTSSTAQTGPSTDPPNPILRASPSPYSIEWSSCQGLGVYLVREPQTEGERFPPTWRPADDPTNLEANFYVLSKCERIAWGPFERGPVFMVLELHDNFVTPDACRGEPGQGRFILQSLLFSDPEIAAYAASFGLPSSLATINVESTPNPQGEQTRWSWTLAGGTSEAQFASRDDSLLDEVSSVWRLYWGNGTTVAYMDWEHSIKTPQPDKVVSYGLMAPPMLWARGLETPFFEPNASDQMIDATFSATIHQFRDAQCEEPL